MLRAAILLGLGLCPIVVRQASAEKTAIPAQKPTKAAPKAMTLSSFIQATLVNGFPARLPGSIAEQVGIAREAPYYGLAVESDQAIDSMYHSFRVMADLSDETKPVGLLLETAYDWPGNSETYWYRTLLNGKLEKVVVLHGKRDEAGKSIKGAGIITEKDINAPEIKQRFQHELDLWLKKAYLKKEWHSAEFSGGSLKKKGKGQ